MSRTVGVALANNAVRVYFEKGAPLPAKRTFVHHTVETVTPGTPGPALSIPLVQGELEEAHLCRLIGTLEIDGKDLDVVVPANTAVEVTLELDKGGQLSARAFIPSLKRVFEHVAHLVVPEASITTLRTGVVQVLDRLASLRAAARARGQQTIAERVDGLLREQHDANRPSTERLAAIKRPRSAPVACCSTSRPRCRNSSPKAVGPSSKSALSTTSPGPHR